MTDIRGVDSYSEVSERLILQATSALGVKPAFWGRYFTNVSSRQAEYRHRVEGPLLAAHGIRVLPIARQTNRVHGTEADGGVDGAANAADIAATFSSAELAGGCRIFLDVEGSKGIRPSILSVDYYRGWAGELAASGITPCVYGIPGDAVTWGALSRACLDGAICGGVWLSRPYRAPPEPVPWTPSMLVPYVGIPDVPILLWQYGFGPDFDRNLVAPDAPDDWLQSLPLPIAS